MYIKEIKLKNFKMFSHHEISFNKGLNIIVGGTSTGKSTIIDAIRFVIDPFYENNSENLNLHSFKYKPSNSDYSKTGYVELSFLGRNTDSKIFTVRRCFSDLSVIKINQCREMKMGEFYHILRSHNYLTNSFMPSFIELEVLYRIDNNNALFKHLFGYMSEHIRYFELIRNLIISSQNILKSKIGKLTDYSNHYLATLAEEESNVITRLHTTNYFNEYIYNMKKQRNGNYLLQRVLDNLNYLAELQRELCDIHEIDIQNVANFSMDMDRKANYCNFVDINNIGQKIVQDLDMLYNNIIEIHTVNISSVVSYPSQLDAHQQINRYVMNLRRTLKAKNQMAKSIESDIKLLKTISERKRSKRANLIESIKSNLIKFANIKGTLEDIILSMADPDPEENTSVQPFKRAIDFFLDNYLFYLKNKLILSFDYCPSILKGLQIATKICHDHRIIPVFKCIRFKNDFIIEDNLYDILKPILEWIIIIETANAPFVIPKLPPMCHITWVPTQHLYSSTDIVLEAETQYIWDGIDFEALHEMEILMECEKKILKFIFYQRDLTMEYENSMLSGGNESHPNDIIDLCDTLKIFFRIATLRDENESHTNIFTNQTEIPNELCSFKKRLDSIISLTNTIKNDFKILLTITEELQFYKEDLKLKASCLKQLNTNSELDLVIEDFDPARYKTCMNNIAELNIQIENLGAKSSSLNFYFNKLFLDVYLPLDGMISIVSDAKLRIKQMTDWTKFVTELMSQFSYCEQMPQNNYTELRATLHNMKKPFLTEDKEISRLIDRNDSKTKNVLANLPIYGTLHQITNIVAFNENMLGEINQAMKTIQKVKHLQKTSDVYANIKIQVLDQINESIKISNRVLKNFNYKMKIRFIDTVAAGENVNEDYTMDVLKSFQFIIQKNINYYPEQSAMSSLIEEIPTQGDLYLAKLMFIFGVSLHNRHKLLTFDDISVMLNKNRNLLINIAQLKEIYQTQQLILTCTPDEIVAKCLKELMRISKFEGVNFININDTQI